LQTRRRGIIIQVFQAFIEESIIVSTIIKSSISGTLVLFLSIAAFAQETQVTVVDEVVAQINDSVITLSQVNREKALVVDEFIKAGKTREEAEREVSEKEGQLIASLITEEMMRQKGVEIGLDKSIEDEINQQLLSLVKENNLKSINELYDVMRGQGIEPELWKKTMRAKRMQQQVLFQSVDSVVYWETSDQELKEYFAKHKDKFLQQESVELSEIFLPFAGKSEADVEALAKALVERLRNGEDFVTLALEYSGRPNVDQNKGVVGEFNVDQLNDDIKTAIKGLREGDISDPVKWDIGIEIVRVDKYVPASTESNFDEAAVRRAVMEEKAPEARREFIRKLREDAYIKIRENYRGVVTPFLQDTPQKETASTDS